MAEASNKEDGYIAGIILAEVGGRTNDDDFQTKRQSSQNICSIKYRG